MRRYILFIIMTIIFLFVILVFPAYRVNALESIRHQVVSMLLVIPPIFILLGLLDVWVPREQMMRYMGEGSSIKGALIAFVLGSFAAGPLYGAFPFAAVLMKKGASITNIMIFIGAWSTTKLPMLLFEVTSMGYRFALSRLAIDIIGIILIAYAVKVSLSPKDIERLIAKAETID
ncbi:MAG: permease [Sphaerochaetaceae bacterium]|nr:permease [Sphaerochaetaceae bacterium]MDD4259012.1 permease [Sphaerochaetaceae bacterium]